MKTITSADQFAALPVGTVISAAYNTDETAPPRPITAIRGDANAASSGDFLIAGGRYWADIFSWADEITVLYSPDPLDELTPPRAVPFKKLRIEAELTDSTVVEFLVRPDSTHLVSMVGSRLNATTAIAALAGTMSANDLI